MPTGGLKMLVRLIQFDFRFSDAVSDTQRNKTRYHDQGRYHSNQNLWNSHNKNSR